MKRGALIGALLLILVLHSMPESYTVYDILYITRS